LRLTFDALVDDATAESRLKAAVNEKMQPLTLHLNDELNADLARLLVEHEATLDGIRRVRVLSDQRRAFVNVTFAMQFTLDE